VKDSRQVVIYFNDPTGQLMQVSHADYKHYWRRIGWTLQGQADHLPGIIPDTAKAQARGLQPNLI